jgi:hypothetical protein
MKSDDDLSLADQQEAFRTIIISNLSQIQNITQEPFL